MSREERRLETIAIHSGGGPDSASGAVVAPIVLSTTFERAADGSFPSGYVYTREANPNRAALERTICDLEGGAGAALFASGSAAASVAVRSLLGPGDEMLIPRDMYHGLRRLLLEGLARWGIRVTQVDMTDSEAVASAMSERTRLLWIETPSNPLLEITDLEEVVGIARRGGAMVACDATWMPGGLLPAFEFGVDLVLHATTKYLAGHSDVLGGALVAREEGEAMERIRFLQRSEGAVPSPFDCWLTLRGIKTLPYRLRGHLENAAAVVDFLARNPGVERVFYPGLPTHRGHGVASRQMRGFGGMLSFLVRGGEEAAMRVAERVQLITRATSLGGVETLIEHRASIEGPNSVTPRNLLRLSVGLEHPLDIIADLEQALEQK